MIHGSRLPSSFPDDTLSSYSEIYPGKMYNYNQNTTKKNQNTTKKPKTTKNRRAQAPFVCRYLAFYPTHFRFTSRSLPGHFRLIK